MPKSESHPHGEAVRLQAFLAHSGVASRRAAEELIASGRVFVNGKSVTAPGTKIRPGVDEVQVEGQTVEVQPVTWIALHKPRGYVTTRIDPYNRKTVYELLPERFHGLFHVGRLDRDSEGLLLLTNDGELANRMLHPSFGVTKEYWADVEGKPTAEEMHRLTEGVEADGETMRADSVRRLHQTGENQHRLSVVMREGKKREVRRMLEALGHPVGRLIRRRFGPVALGELKPGKWRMVADSELSAVRQGKSGTKASRKHSGEDEDAVQPTDRGGERRPKRAPKPEERAKPAGKSGKAAGKAAKPAGPRASDLRLQAREDARRGRQGDDKPRRSAQERDDRPYQERAPAKRGPVRRDESAERPSSRGPVRRGESTERPAAPRGPVRRGESAERPASASRGPARRGQGEERGPSPRDASRGFPKRGGKPAAGPRDRGAGPRGRGDEGDRGQEMETPYPSTRRGSARPSPRGGAADERRGTPDRPQGRGGPKRGPSRPPRDRDDESPASRGPARRGEGAPRSRARDDESARRRSPVRRGGDDDRRPRGRDDESAPRRRPVRRQDGPRRGDEDAPRRPSGSGPAHRREDGDDRPPPRGKGGPPRGGPGGKPGGGPRGRGGPSGKGGGPPRGRS